MQETTKEAVREFQAVHEQVQETGRKLQEAEARAQENGRMWNVFKEAVKHIQWQQCQHGL